MQSIYVDKIVVALTRELRENGIELNSFGADILRDALLAGYSVNISIPLDGGTCDVSLEGRYAREPILAFNCGGHPLPQFTTMIRTRISRAVFPRV